MRKKPPLSILPEVEDQGHTCVNWGRNRKRAWEGFLRADPAPGGIMWPSINTQETCAENQEGSQRGERPGPWAGGGASAEAAAASLPLEFPGRTLLRAYLSLSIALPARSAAPTKLLWASVPASLLEFGKNRAFEKSIRDTVRLLRRSRPVQGARVSAGPDTKPGFSGDFRCGADSW